MSNNFINSDNEIIFSNSTLSLTENEDDLVSDKVNILANGIYQEFENLIKLFGQGSVDGLMPLVVTILETMDKLYTCKDDLSLQLDLMKEDQCQLYTQYEREKLSRKLAEEKIINIEDQLEEEKQQLENRIDMLESNNKLGEMKLRNSRDLILRHEERELEMRKEFNTIQQRYAELLRTKADQKNRNINSQWGADDVSSGCQSPQLSVKQHKSDKTAKSVSTSINHCQEVDNSADEISSKLPDQICRTNELSLKEEFGEENIPQDSKTNWNNEKVHSQVAQRTPLADFYHMNEENFDNVSQIETETRIDNEDICLENDYDDLDMSKEIAFLLRENQDLVETKNALNVVKDDLITKVDELTGELCVLREEVKNSNLLKIKHRTQSQELAKKLHEVTQKLQEKESKLSELGEDENLIECAIDQNGIQTKTKFTRAEMSRILSERNKYKEELLELQEAMRYHVALINQKNGRARKGSMWNFFSNVFSNATAFTTEAFIGSGNEMEIAQLSRNFNNLNRDAITLKDESGSFITLPNLSNQSSSSRKRPNPGLPMRVTNPLFNPIDENNQTMVNLVPLDEIERKSQKHNAVNNSSV